MRIAAPVRQQRPRVGRSSVIRLAYWFGYVEGSKAKRERRRAFHRFVIVRVYASTELSTSDVKGAEVSHLMNAGSSMIEPLECRPWCAGCRSSFEECPSSLPACRCALVPSWSNTNVQACWPAFLPTTDARWLEWQVHGGIWVFRAGYLLPASYWRLASCLHWRRRCPARRLHLPRSFSRKPDGLSETIRRRPLRRTAKPCSSLTAMKPSRS